METEIERKFLVDRLPENLSESHHIEQGYLGPASDSSVGVRLRRIDLTNAFLTVKGGRGVRRVEVELPLSRNQFEALWPLTEGRRLIKTRFIVPLEGGLHIDLDSYEARLEGLITAEVEFGSESAAQAFVPPNWFGREVTGDPKYLNSSLAA
jgi:CYTH domain-containing protein